MEFEELTILVAEDHAFQRRVAVGILERLGARRVLEASHGMEALAALRAADGAVDVVLCDLDMPGMDGVEFIRRVAEEHLATALVIVSALEPAIVDSVERMSRAHGHLVLGTIEKPVSAQKLQNVLANLKGASRGPVEVPRRFTVDDIRRGIAAREFEPWFQPKVRMSDQSVAGAEALARWRHPEAGIVRPGAFLSEAEAAGLSDELAWQVIDKTLQARAAWPSPAMAIPVSINVSLRFLEDLRTADMLVARAASFRVEPRSIILEVTEDVASTNFVNVMENLARLRIKGFGVSIDDYGTGYSSVQQLSRIPYTELKLDQSFVTGAAHKPTMRTILESALLLAKRMNLASVAEGIEREEEWTLLKSLGCDMAQGYYISPPVSAAEFPTWFADWMGSLHGAGE
jgi:EAL domain-containing protein (putative c-di-GMP-specific phosphodiesterase class I)/CheY-like chemotaxis protein